MINAQHFRLGIVRPTLTALAPEIPYSMAAENLLMGTAVHESRLSYLYQIKGPALGLYQMEPATFSWLWDDWLEKRPALKEKFRDFAGGWRVAMPESEMVGNLYFATALCRLRYWVAPGRLPDPDDVRALAEYWKRYYNTEHGRGTVEQWIDAYSLTFERRSSPAATFF